jgi:hypothetical protein
MRKLLLGLSLILLTACTSPVDARRVLEQQGYTEVKTGGYGWFTCDEKDTFSTKFTAKSPNGTYVSGVVCSGLLKGNTIRFN